MELKSFKRLSNGNILLDGIIWGSDPDKGIDISNISNGYKVHSIRIEDNWYYPHAVTPKAKVKKAEPIKTLF